MKKIIVSVLIICCLALTGCGSIYDKEYISIKEYDIPQVQQEIPSDTVTVANFSNLKKQLSSMVNKGLSGGTIIFDTTYPGDITKDISLACWSVRTQNALCVYCVENISYEVTKILTNQEAKINISYTISPEKFSEILKMGFLTGFDKLMLDAYGKNTEEIVILVNNCNYSADDLQETALNVYRNHPSSCVREPDIVIQDFSGSGLQKLYDISIKYGMPQEEIERIKSELSSVDYSELAGMTGKPDESKAAAIAEFLINRRSPEYENTDNTLYAALVAGNADSEGCALAFNELAGKYGLKSQMVYGQKNREDHVWNIINIGENYYHIDVSACTGTGPLNLFKSDADIWGEYRWNTLSYPACDQSLTVQTDAAEK